MHFFGITVAIICKFFEVVKSNIILMTDCNNHLHTLSKKNVFEFHHFWRKQRGASHLVAKKKQFFGLTKISGRGSQNSTG